MNSLSVIVFFVAVAYASASLLAGGAVIAGPAGVIRSAVAPGAIVGAHGGVIGYPGLLGAAGIIAPGAGYEGQWIPDITEHLYDDGSYKPWLYGH